MKRVRWFGPLLGLTVALSPVRAGHLDPAVDIDEVNRHLAGTVIDHTHNGGVDRRIWSPSLGQWRDLYVYLPPGFDPSRRYPFFLYLHPFLQDEHSLIDFLVKPLDRAIQRGRLPPVIVAAPDGSIKGRPSYLSTGSFFVNSQAGNFEDFIILDVLRFVTTHYPVRPEREAHVIAGASMGGFGAYNLAMKHPDLFKIVVGIFPPLNMRWVNCRGRYMAGFDPCCWGWRDQVDRGHEVIGRFYHGLVTVRLKRVIDPLFGRGPEALEAVKRENPIELIDRLNLPDGVLDMYVAYGGRDEFNIDAQVESFLYRAKQRGLTVTVDYDPKGRHNADTARKFFPGVIAWLAPRLEPFRQPIDSGCAPTLQAGMETPPPGR